MATRDGQRLRRRRGEPRRGITRLAPPGLLTRGERRGHRGEGKALGNLGNAYADLGQVDKAIGCYEQPLAIARAIGDRQGEGRTLGNLGRAYASLGQVDEGQRRGRVGLRGQEVTLLGPVDVPAPE